MCQKTKIKTEIFVGFVILNQHLDRFSKIKTEINFNKAQNNNLLISNLYSVLIFLIKNPKWSLESTIPSWLLQTLVPAPLTQWWLVIGDCEYFQNLTSLLVTFIRHQQPHLLLRSTRTTLNIFPHSTITMSPFHDDSDHTFHQ